MEVIKQKRVLPFGPAGAKLAVVGDGPGRAEEETGRPLTGPSGAFLRALLEELGADPESVWWASVFETRGAKAEARGVRERGRALLGRLADLPNLGAVLALGRVAALALTGRRDQIQDFRDQNRALLNKIPEGAPVIVTFHPAALLRTGRRRSRFWRRFRSDVSRAVELSEGVRKRLPNRTAEAGVHVHNLERESSATKEDGDHSHLFLLPDGTALWTNVDGGHAHPLDSPTANESEPGTGKHSHRVTLPDGTELTTEVGGGHDHQLQAWSSAFDGVHKHELRLPGGAAVENFLPGDYWEHQGRPPQRGAPPPELAKALIDKGRGEELAELFERSAQEVVVVPDWLSVTGSYVYAQDGREPNDLDLVARGWVGGAGPNLKFQRMYAEITGKPVQVTVEETGPNWWNVPVYDLVARKKRTLEVREVEEDFVRFYKQRLRVPEAQREASESEKKDEVDPGRMIFPTKPLRIKAGLRQTLENFLGQFEEADFPTWVSKKYDGMRALAFKSKGELRLLSDDGRDITGLVPRIAEAFDALADHDFVLDSELERWRDSQHLPREAARAAVETEKDDELVANIFDVVHWGRDLHKQPFPERRKVLDRIKGQRTDGVPDLDQPINVVPHHPAKDIAELEKVIERVSGRPGSEGVVVTFGDGNYPLDGGESVKTNRWRKFHKAGTIRAMVIERIETATPGVFVHRYGIDPGDQEPAEAKTVEGRELLVVGKTFSTAQKFDPGDLIEVEFEQLNLVETADGKVKMTLWVPELIGPAKGDLDTIRKAVGKARDAGILQVKRERKGEEPKFFPTNEGAEEILKQRDPYLVYPDPERPKPYIVHHHWRGRSLHADLRILRDEVAVGWTINSQVQGVVKEPVTTLAQAKKVLRDKPELSKIDWETGVSRERRTRARVVIRAQLRAQQKATEIPRAWMIIEGKTADPEEGKPVPVGGTREFPGVFHIVDKGRMTFGAQKPDFHEYFVEEGKLQGGEGRLAFRLIRRTEKGLAVSHDATEGEMAAIEEQFPNEPVVKLWTVTRECCCQRTVEYTAEKDGHESGVVTCPACAAARQLTVEKQEVKPPPLPPGVQEDTPREPVFWTMIFPKDPRPFVLSKRAVEEKWLPPRGVSALPTKIKRNVPEALRYWEQPRKKALGSRRTLAESEELDVGEVKAIFTAKKYFTSQPVGDLASLAFSRGPVEEWWDGAFREYWRRQAEELDREVLKQTGEFSLLRRWWRGQIVIRFGPSEQHWVLMLRDGKGRVFLLERNPIDNPIVAAAEEDPGFTERHFSLKERVSLAPGTRLNPTKDTPAFLEPVDSGKLTVLAEEAGLLKLSVKGEKLKGAWLLRRDKPGQLWDMERVEEGPTVEAVFGHEILKAEEHPDFTFVLSPILVPDEPDAHGDVVSADEIEKAAHGFVENSRKGSLMHRFDLDASRLVLVESYIMRHTNQISGVRIAKGTWMGGWRIYDPELRSQVRGGELRGFSIGGRARVAVA